MARYIDLDKLKEFDCDGIACIKEGCAECFYNNGGAEDVAPVIHSKWEELTDGGYLYPRMICSNCSNISTPLVSWKFCPICGAKINKGVSK